MDRLFSIFVHYALKKDQDWKALSDGNIKVTASGKKKLRKDLKLLANLLKFANGWRGFAYLFLDPGWADLLDHPKKGWSLASLGAALAGLQAEVDKLVGRQPVRLVTAARLIRIIGVLEANAPSVSSRFSSFLLGHPGSLQYDSPKVVEAIIRIANFGRNMPVFRFDSDVLFGAGKHGKIWQRNTRSNIDKLCGRFVELTDHPDVHYFVFSGGYLSENDQMFFEDSASPSAKIIWQDMALNGFATRMLALAQVPSDAASGFAAAKLEFKLTTARRFLQDLWRLGANPFRQVISGAGLCLSDSAILDLPPFSNMRENVMWIDDHLKFALHDELRHFELPPSVGNWPRPAIGRVDNAFFRQDRHVHSASLTLADVRRNTVEYLPRLLRGIVADAWLREAPELKRSAADPEIRARTQGQFAQYFIARLAGMPLPLVDVRSDMWRRAVERLRAVVDLWSHPDYSGTFLGVVVKGAAELPPASFSAWHDFFSALFPEGLQKAVSQLPEDYPANGRPSHPLARFCFDLIEDFVSYVELVQFWMHFVQSVRFQLNTPADRSEAFWAFPAEGYVHHRHP